MHLSVSALTAELCGVRSSKFGTGIDLDNILDRIEGQGHRSNVKVIQLNNVIFKVFPGFSVS